MNLDLNTVKTYLKIGESDNTQDALIILLIEGVSYDVKNFCNITTIPAELTFVLLKLIAFNYSNDKFVQSETVTDSTTTFATDYPDDIKRQLYKYRKL